MVSCDSSDEDCYQDAAKYAGITPEDSDKHRVDTSVDKDRVDILVAKARALYNAGDYKAAGIAFLQAEECDPLAPGRWKHANNVSACMLRLGDNEATLEHTKRVLEVRLAIGGPKHHQCTRFSNTLLLARYYLHLLPGTWHTIQLVATQMIPYCIYSIVASQDSRRNRAPASTLQVHVSAGYWPT